jgi:hypothetical protein
MDDLTKLPTGRKNGWLPCAARGGLEKKGVGDDRPRGSGIVSLGSVEERGRFVVGAEAGTGWVSRSMRAYNTRWLPMPKTSAFVMFCILFLVKKSYDFHISTS